MAAKIHFINAKNGRYAFRSWPFVPRVGDELRFSDDDVGTVTRVVWCLDEEPEGFSDAVRVNVGFEWVKKGNKQTSIKEPKP